MNKLNQEGIDAVGACVGLRGIRIQNVVNELLGEKIELNRTVMICEYNVKRKKIDFNVGVIGDIINQDQLSVDTIQIPLFIAFVGPNDVVIDKWSKNNIVKVKNRKITSFSLGIENLRSDIIEGRTGSSYKVLIGIQK